MTCSDDELTIGIDSCIKYDHTFIGQNNILIFSKNLEMSFLTNFTDSNNDVLTDYDMLERSLNIFQVITKMNGQDKQPPVEQYYITELDLFIPYIIFSSGFNLKQNNNPYMLNYFKSPNGFYHPYREDYNKYQLLPFKQVSLYLLYHLIKPFEQTRVNMVKQKFSTDTIFDSKGLILSLILDDIVKVLYNDHSFEEKNKYPNVLNRYALETSSYLTLDTKKIMTEYALTNFYYSKIVFHKDIAKHLMVKINPNSNETDLDRYIPYTRNSYINNLILKRKLKILINTNDVVALPFKALAKLLIIEAFKKHNIPVENKIDIKKLRNDETYLEEIDGIEKNQCNERELKIYNKELDNKFKQDLNNDIIELCKLSYSSSKEIVKNEADIKFYFTELTQFVDGKIFEILDELRSTNGNQMQKYSQLDFSDYIKKMNLDAIQGMLITLDHIIKCDYKNENNDDSNNCYLNQLTIGDYNKNPIYNLLKDEVVLELGYFASKQYYIAEELNPNTEFKKLNDLNLSKNVIQQILNTKDDAQKMSYIKELLSKISEHDLLTNFKNNNNEDEGKPERYFNNDSIQDLNSYLDYIGIITNELTKKEL